MASPAALSLTPQEVVVFGEPAVSRQPTTPLSELGVQSFTPQRPQRVQEGLEALLPADRHKYELLLGDLEWGAFYDPMRADDGAAMQRLRRLYRELEEVAEAEAASDALFDQLEEAAEAETERRVRRRLL